MKGEQNVSQAKTVCHDGTGVFLFGGLGCRSSLVICLVLGFPQQNNP